MRRDGGSCGRRRWRGNSKVAGIGGLRPRHRPSRLPLPSFPPPHYRPSRAGGNQEMPDW